MTKDSKAIQKNKHLYLGALIGLGFLWTGTAYILQAYRLLQFLEGDKVNLLVCGLYYICQAIGILAFSLLLANHPRLASGPLLPLWSSLITLILAGVAVFVSSLPIIIIAGGLMNLTIGVLSACYLTRLATDIPQKHRGIVFGGAYAFGSIATWLLSLPMDKRFLWTSYSFYAVVVLTAISLILLSHLPPLAKQDKKIGQLGPGFGKNTIWLASLVIFLLSLENTLGFSFPLKSTKGTVYIEFTRAFYALGPIIAGLVSDKNRRWGAICCLAGLSFPFAALALGNSVLGETSMWIVAYLFLGFWSTYRILVFSDISANKGLAQIAVAGLLFGRLGEAVGTASAHLLKGTPLILASSIVFALIIILFFSLFQKLYSPIINIEEVEKQQLSEYASHFKLSLREQEIFKLIMQGMSNAEIANVLFITESTVKFHAGNIFKKTGLSNRSALIADYKVRSTV